MAKENYKKDIECKGLKLFARAFAEYNIVRFLANIVENKGGGESGGGGAF